MEKLSYAGNWISTNERLPPHSVYVLARWCKYDPETIDEAYRHNPMLLGEYWYRRCGIEMITPSYWMPMPVENN
jgi:hypothetical protein